MAESQNQPRDLTPDELAAKGTELFLGTHPKFQEHQQAKRQTHFDAIQATDQVRKRHAAAVAKAEKQGQPPPAPLSLDSADEAARVRFQTSANDMSFYGSGAETTEVLAKCARFLLDQAVAKENQRRLAEGEKPLEPAQQEYFERNMDELKPGQGGITCTIERIQPAQSYFTDASTGRAVASDAQAKPKSTDVLNVTELRRYTISVDLLRQAAPEFLASVNQQREGHVDPISLDPQGVNNRGFDVYANMQMLSASTSQLSQVLVSAVPNDKHEAVLKVEDNGPVTRGLLDPEAVRDYVSRPIERQDGTKALDEQGNEMYYRLSPSAGNMGMAGVDSPEKMPLLKDVLAPGSKYSAPDASREDKALFSAATREAQARTGAFAAGRHAGSRLPLRLAAVENMALRAIGKLTPTQASAQARNPSMRVSVKVIGSSNVDRHGDPSWNVDTPAQQRASLVTACAVNHGFSRNAFGNAIPSPTRADTLTSKLQAELDGKRQSALTQQIHGGRQAA